MTRWPQDDDKRLQPKFTEDIWCERTSEREWHYCKYCHREVPTFLLDEGEMGSMPVIHRLRCCWECGSGLAKLEPPVGVGGPVLVGER